MLHLMKYDVKVKLRNFNEIFWPLIFPLILATFFQVSFGKTDETGFETVPVAVVTSQDNETDEAFLEFLEGVESDDTRLICIKEMKEKEALEALEDKKAAGIFYAGKTPSLTVGGVGMKESLSLIHISEPTRPY